MKVRTTRLGYYDLRRRYPEGEGRDPKADEFELDYAEDFSVHWMKPIDDEAREAAAIAQKKADEFASKMGLREKSEKIRPIKRKVGKKAAPSPVVVDDKPTGEADLI